MGWMFNLFGFVFVYGFGNGEASMICFSIALFIFMKLLIDTFQREE